jgi:lipopolysaccharide/colanic/teichoic acid biosynthesis glycosyltransferase
LKNSNTTAYNFIKRTFDIVASILALLFLAPFFLLFAILIKRDSPGPVFYRGERVGRFGKHFSIIKFRTMREDSESKNSSPLTSMGDARVTQMGKWLRDTKINEIPQLWNVLKGDMSLVGPRPEDPAFVKNWPADTRSIILSVRPGVTSPASVSYRNEEEKLGSTNVIEEYIYRIAPEKMRLDLLYVQQHSFFCDLDIIFMTFALLIPLLRKVELPARTYFSGPIFQFVRRYLSWFIIDAFVAFISISVTVGIWRLTGPLDLGWGISFGLAFGMALLFTLFNFILGVNRISWRQAGPGWILKLFVSSGLVLLVLSALNVSSIPLPKLPLALVWLAGALTLTGMIIIRYRERLLTGLAYRWLHLRKRAVGEIEERALLVGAGRSAQLVGWMMNHSANSHSINIVGMVDDNPEKVGMRIGDYRVLGSIEEIPHLVEMKGISLILYAIYNLPQLEQERIIKTCRQTPARLIVLPDYIKMFSEEIMRKDEALE